MGDINKCKAQYRVKSILLILITYLWYETNMDITEVLSFCFELKLSKGFNKWHSFNISNGSTQLKKKAWICQSGRKQKQKKKIKCISIYSTSFLKCLSYKKPWQLKFAGILCKELSSVLRMLFPVENIKQFSSFVILALHQRYKLPMGRCVVLLNNVLSHCLQSGEKVTNS